MKSELYYLWQDEQQKGPFTLEQLRSMWSAGAVNVQTLYSQGAEWKHLAEIQSQLNTPRQVAVAQVDTFAQYHTPLTYNSKGRISFVGWLGMLFGAMFIFGAVAMYYDAFKKQPDTFNTDLFLGLLVSGLFFGLGSFFWARK